MKIAQITDIHIGRPEDESHGVDVRSNFKTLLSKVSQFKPDFLVITGDLCLHDGERSIYRWIKSQLDNLNFPVYIIPGNHDNSSILAENFGLQAHLVNEELFFEVKMGVYSFLFLDSGKGIFTPTQWQWLQEQLMKDGNKIVFMHHPPIRGGVPFMDNKYPFEQWEQFVRVVSKQSDQIPVFCGHYHVDKSIFNAQIQTFITPSGYFQIDFSKADFMIDHYQIGYRRIILEDNRLETSVHYFDGAPSK